MRLNRSERLRSRPFGPAWGGCPPMLSRKQGRSFPTPGFTARLAPSRHVSWAPPSAGAEKWEKWRKWLACQKYESDGPADCTVAFARRRRRRNDDDKGSISNTENQFSSRAPHNLRIEILSTTFFLEKQTRENGRNVHALDSTSRGARERLRDGVGGLITLADTSKRRCLEGCASQLLSPPLEIARAGRRAACC